MKSFGSRLREERERMGVSVTQLAGLARLSDVEQVDLESDRAPLDAWSLNRFARVGVDVYYILTGERLQMEEARAGQTCSTRTDSMLALSARSSQDGQRLIESVADDRSTSDSAHRPARRNSRRSL